MKNELVKTYNELCDLFLNNKKPNTSNGELIKSIQDNYNDGLIDETLAEKLTIKLGGKLVPNSKVQLLELDKTYIFECVLKTLSKISDLIHQEVLNTYIDKISMKIDKDYDEKLINEEDVCFLVTHYEKVINLGLMRKFSDFDKMLEIELERHKKEFALDNM